MTISISNDPTEEDSLPRCGVCGRSESDHGAGQTAHKFSLSGKLEKQSAREAPPARVRRSPDDEQQMTIPSSTDQIRLPPGDPVLRMALIRAGIISVDQLEEVERELRATGASFTAAD